jgi:hypothetical protein
MASPADSVTAPVVFTTPVAEMVSLSVTLPVEPAVRLMAPPLLLCTVPSTFKGLCAVRVIAPSLVETVLPLATVIAPVLLMMMLPVLPGVDCETLLSVSAPVLTMLMSVLAPELLAVRLLI